MAADHQRGDPQHYEELGVAPSASLPEIRAAYVALARAHHPDHAGDRSDPERAASAARMARVNAAWTVLSDPSKRAAYDARRSSDGDGAGTWQVRDADTTFRPLDDADDVDPRLLDDTPTGAPTLPRAAALLPAGLATAGLASVLFAAIFGFGGLLILGFFILALAGLSFLALPFIALINASRAERG